MNGLDTLVGADHADLDRRPKQTLLDGILIAGAADRTVADEARILDAGICDMHVSGKHIIDLVAEHGLDALNRGFKVVVHIAVDADIRFAHDAKAADG